MSRPPVPMPINSRFKPMFVGSNPIAGGASCTINVAFAPQAIGPYQAEIDIIDNSGGLAAAKQVIALSGTGVAASPIANLSPASLTFGTLAVGTTSGPQPITLRNLGSAALTLSQLTFTGSDAASFAVAPVGTTCPIGSTVAIGANCLVQIVFAPQTSGAKSATVNFNDNASGSPQSISLSGMAIAPTVQISPSALTFAAQSVGTASPSQTITLSSTGTSSVTINGITVTGPNAADFSENGNCSAVLGARRKLSSNRNFQTTRGREPLRLNFNLRQRRRQPAFGVLNGHRHSSRCLHLAVEREFRKPVGRLSKRAGSSHRNEHRHGSARHQLHLILRNKPS